MDPRIEKLLDVLQANGWTLLGSADVVSDWWFSDILHLISKWRPINTNIYLTLLTDPSISRKKIVWCIGISSEVPTDRHFPFINQVTLNNIKKIDLNDFVDKINKSVLSR